MWCFTAYTFCFTRRLESLFRSRGSTGSHFVVLGSVMLSCESGGCFYHGMPTSEPSCASLNLWMGEWCEPGEKWWLACLLTPLYAASLSHLDSHGLPGLSQFELAGILGCQNSLGLDPNPYYFANRAIIVDFVSRQLICVLMRSLIMAFRKNDLTKDY